MAGRPVAVEGDVTATAGTVLLQGADSGAWTAGTVEETASDTLSVGGSFVLHKASCTFTFKGKAGQAAVTGKASVELTPDEDGLLVSSSGVLLDGDTAKDGHGNTLTVGSASRLHMA